MREGITNLGHPLWTDEAACLNVAQARLSEPVYQLCFDGRRYWSWFVLEAITRADFDDAHKVGLARRMMPTVAGCDLSQTGCASLPRAV